jgi:hypothetical protein
VADRARRQSNQVDGRCIKAPKATTGRSGSICSRKCKVQGEVKEDVIKKNSKAQAGRLETQSRAQWKKTLNESLGRRRELKVNWNADVA